MTPERAPSRSEADEVGFFAKYYATQAYNPTGWRLRLTRERRSLLKRCGTDRLGRVLSLGCGDGQFELMLAPHATHVTGLDISPEAIAVARENAAREGAANVEFRCQSLRDLRWDEAYDTIVCLAFLHHLTAPQVAELLEAAHTHLVPGGGFYSQDPNRRGILRHIGRLLLGRSYDRYHSPDERELDTSEVADGLARAGFSQVQVGFIDVTLIPALFVLAKGPGWPLYGCAAFDWLWCRLPTAPLASGFTAFARR